MELLAPAGSLPQAIASIKGGCDALYGGLKKWSARSRAANFTIEEYCELINICKHRNIRFYLTLNTLVNDSELNAIIDLFSNSTIPHPDAFIVGDIGLCDTLKKNFPETPIHASTQFGAYTLRDALFFQSQGVKRIILARELTLEEVCYIKSHADIEVEVFVYGNQCIAFSGNCLWGGLTKTGSGHKGGCIGSCNDFYQTRDGAIGNFFWSTNIGLFNFASCLESKGIDCIKIEGRLRKSDEVIEVVSKFRKALNGESTDNDYDFDGYLAGKLPPHHQLHYFNPQNTFQNFESIVYTENDIVVKETQEESRLSLGDGDVHVSSIKKIKIEELRTMQDKEALILRGCGGNLQEWTDGISEELRSRDIYFNGRRTNPHENHPFLF